MSTSAHERKCWQSECAARDIANSLFQKWAIKGFFPAGERSEPRTRTAPKGLPQDEAWAERERVPSGHNCRRQLATGRPEQIQGPGTAVPGTPIFANYAKRGGPPLESPCRWLSFAPFSFATERKVRTPHRAVSPAPAPESARHTPSKGMRLQAHQRAFRSPFGNLRTPKLARNPRDCTHCSCKKFSLLEANKMTFLGANHQRSPHCRAHSLLFA